MPNGVGVVLEHHLEAGLASDHLELKIRRSTPPTSRGSMYLDWPPRCRIGTRLAATKERPLPLCDRYQVVIHNLPLRTTGDHRGDMRRLVFEPLVNLMTKFGYPSYGIGTGLLETVA
jgi:hypothetical protein